MTIQVHAQPNNRWLVEVDGRLDQTQNLELERSLTHLLDEGAVELVIDMTGTEYINSGGLRCLVSTWRKAREAGGDVLLCGLNDRLQEIFSMVGFDKVFRFYPTSKQAIDALKTP